MSVANDAFPFEIVGLAGRVYWLAQPASGAVGAPRDGSGLANLYTVDAHATFASATLVASGFSGAVALAHDGENLYFGATDVSGGSIIYTVPPATSAAAATPFKKLTTNQRVLRLTAIARGVLVAVQEDGNVVRIDATDAPVSLGNVGVAPTLARGQNVVYGGAFFAADVQSFLDKGGNSVAGTLPGASGAGAGARALASNCDAIFVARDTGMDTIAKDGGVAFSDAGAPIPDIADLRADGTFVYVARQNAGGVFRAREDNPGILEELRPGDVWRIAVTADAIYWGDHGGSPGAIHRIDK